jgi:hypothetical protein
VVAVTIIGGAASLKVVALLVAALFGVEATSLILLAVPALAVYNTVVAPNTVVLAAAPVTVISIVFPLTEIQLCSTLCKTVNSAFMGFAKFCTLWRKHLLIS